MSVSHLVLPTLSGFRIVPDGHVGAGDLGELDGTRETLVTLGVVVLEADLELDGLEEVALLLIERVVEELLHVGAHSGDSDLRHDAGCLPRESGSFGEELCVTGSRREAATDLQVCENSAALWHAKPRSVRFRLGQGRVSRNSEACQPVLPSCFFFSIHTLTERFPWLLAQCSLLADSRRISTSKQGLTIIKTPTPYSALSALSAMLALLRRKHGHSRCCTNASCEPVST